MTDKLGRTAMTKINMTKINMTRINLLALGSTMLAALALASSANGEMQKIGAPPEASNIRLVGYNELQARSAYQPTIVHQGDRYIAYIRHHGGSPEVPRPINPQTGEPEFNGTSIVDVTDPAHPKYLKHIPGTAGSGEGGGAQMTRICAGATLPRADRGKFYMLRTLGTRGHEVWDVTDPTKPALLASIGGNYKDTHKSWWECDSGVAYIVSAVPGWRVNRMTEIFDLGDPAHPVKIRHFGLPSQEPGSTGPVPPDVHSPITLPQNNRIYFGYRSSKRCILQIVDRDKLLHGPKAPTPQNQRCPTI